MVVLTCVNTIRNKNDKTLAYEIIDSAGNSRILTKEQVVNTLARDGVIITNLRVGVDGRVYNPIKESKIQRVSHAKKSIGKDAYAKKNIQYENIGDVADDTFVLSRKGLATILDKVGKADKLDFRTNTTIRIEEIRAKKNGACSVKVTVFENQAFLIKADDSAVLCTIYDNIRLEDTDSADEMFMDCRIHDIDTRILDNAKIVYMNKMFKQAKVNSNTLNMLDTREVVSMENMFEGYRPFNEVIHISGDKWNTENLRYMNEMFYACTANLISIHGINLEKVLEMKGMFSKCKATLDIKGVSTCRLTDTSRMFELYENDRLNIDWLDTRRVTNMQQMFLCCKTKEIKLHKLNLENVKSFREALAGSMTDIIVVPKIGEKGIDYTMMFRKAVSKLLNIGIFRIAEDTMIDNILTDCVLDKIIINNLIIDKDTDDTLISKIFSKVKVGELIIKRTNADKIQIDRIRETLGSNTILRIGIS